MLRKTMPTTETAPYPHPTLYPENQRQSRTLHPIRAARMGLRSRLRQLQPARRVPPLLAAPIQLASTTRQLEIPNTHPIPQYPAEQRGGFTHLGRQGRPPFVLVTRRTHLDRRQGPLAGQPCQELSIIPEKSGARIAYISRYRDRKIRLRATGTIARTPTYNRFLHNTDLQYVSEFL